MFDGLTEPTRWTKSSRNRQCEYISLAFRCPLAQLDLAPLTQDNQRTLPAETDILVEIFPAAALVILVFLCFMGGAGRRKT